MAWTIQEQTEKQGKNETTVLCKHVKFFPITGAGGQVVDFGRLKPLVFSIIIKSDAGYTLRLSMSISKGLFAHPMFTVAHPDTMGKPMIWVGSGKTRRQIKDELSRDVVIPGEKEKYPYQMDFEKRVRSLGGEALLSEVLALFAARVAPFAARAA
jgi:hypothetical protein